MKTRDAFWDLSKFFAIFLVVFSHVSVSSRMTFGQPYVKNFIVNMNMPFFFLISGYFSWGLVKSGDWKRFAMRMLSYFVPLFIFSLILNTCECVFELLGYVDSFPKEVLKGFLFNWWFVWVLAICLATVFACFKGGGKNMPIFLICAVFMGSLFVRHAWWVGSFRHMFPFFVLGLCWKAKNGNLKNLLAVKVGLPCLLLFVMAVILEGTAYQHRLYWYGVDSSWWGMTADRYAVLWELTHYALGVLGSVGVMWVVALLVKIMPAISNLAPLGETTLGVYLLHQWLLLRLQEWNLLSSNVLVVAGWTIALFAVTHFITRLTMKSIWSNRIVWGKWLAH